MKMPFAFTIETIAELGRARCPQRAAAAWGRAALPKRRGFAAASLFCILHFTLSIAAFSAAAYDDVQVTYRGRLKKNSAAPAAQTVSMTFRLYKGKKDNDASWTMVKDDVMISEDGLFQVALRGQGLEGRGLAEMIDDGRVNWIGVAIDGGKEQYPRQAILASPGAEKSIVADGLAASPSIETAKVGPVDASALSARSLSVDGAISIRSATAPASMNVELTKAWHVINVKGRTRFFNAAPPRDLGTVSVANGVCRFANADCNCVALFTSENSDVMPGMSLFVKNNDLIEVPSGVGLKDGTVVRCRIYQIGVE